MGEDVISKLFDKIDGIAVDVALIKGKTEEKEKRCNDHAKITEDQGKRLRSVELWRASQQGASAIIQRWGPVFISGAIATWAVIKH